MPITLLSILVASQLVSRLGFIPSPESFIDRLASALGQENYYFVLAASFLESAVILNAYFPGGFVILSAMASTHGSPEAAVRMYFAIFAGAFVAHQYDYGLGRALAKGFLPQLREALSRGSRRQLATNGWIPVALYLHPQTGSLYSYQLGSRQLRYTTFLSRVTAGWGLSSVFWGILMYNIGRVPLTSGAFIGISYTYLIIWTAHELLHRGTPATRSHAA